jgi:hypothetical protein
LPQVAIHQAQHRDLGMAEIDGEEHPAGIVLREFELTWANPTVAQA